MKVWTASYDYEYEGTSLSGIFSTEELAEAWKATQPRNRMIVIDEVEVDALISTSAPTKETP